MPSFDNLLNTLERTGNRIPIDPNHTFDSDKFLPLEIKEQCVQYCAKFSEVKAENIGLLISGGAGTGKTFLSECIANELKKSGYDALMITPTIIAKGYSFDRIDNSGNTPYDHLINAVNKIPLLILDDLGAGRDTEYANEHVLSIIDRRLRVKLPLLVTTNIEPEVLLRYAGFASGADVGGDEPIMRNRIYSRVLEACPKRFILNAVCVRKVIANERRDRANDIITNK